MQERDVIIDWRKQEVAKLRDQKTSYTPEELNAKIMVCLASSVVHSLVALLDSMVDGGYSGTCFPRLYPGVP